MHQERSLLDLTLVDQVVAMLQGATHGAQHNG
jgi:hypothetical protein